MKTCINCDQSFDDSVSRCKNCTQLLFPSAWISSPRDIKSPIKIHNLAKVFGSCIEIEPLSWFMEPITNLNNGIGTEISKYMTVFFEDCIRNNIIKDEESLKNEVKLLWFYTGAWVGACYLIGVEGEKNNIDESMKFEYITYVTNAYLIHIFKYPWALYNQKFISTENYQKFISGFSLFTCYKNALKAEKDGYLESFRIDDLNSNFLSDLKQIITKE